MKNNSNDFNFLTKDCQVAINNTVKYAQEKNFEYITVDNLMLFLSSTQRGREIFEAMGVNLNEFRKGVEEYLSDNIPQNNISGEIQATIPFRNILEQAYVLKKAAGNDLVDEGYILVALFELDNEDSYIMHYFKHFGITRFDIVSYLSHGKKKVQTKTENKETSDSSKSFLGKFAILLNTKAENGRIDPIIGREEEINKVITILAQRRKNNPILVGDPGVGKTAIAEGLAKKIVEKSVPAELENALIYSVDLPSVVAGTKYRGDFEERLKGIIKEASQNPDIILFIDEIHTLIGTGAGNSTMDASNMLKPALSSGELKVVGATTYDEYRKIFEKEGALSRRFQKVEVVEPSEEDSIKILLGLKSQYEEFHKIKYDDNAIEAAVKLTSKYINDRKLPDKAIDIIDMVGAEVKLSKEVEIITEKEVSKIVAKVVRIPVNDIEATEKNKLKSLESELKAEIYGQDDAIDQIVDTVIYSRGIGALKPKPIGSFLLAGPSGVGKTELSKQVAQKLGIPFLRFDMSEYMEKHTVARLVGAPPGYVGYDQGGQLTDIIKKNPHSVLLFDEIEKAHPDIFNILLQVMDYGVLTDSNGVKADFKNVIFMMTSNVGAAEMTKKSIGFTGDEKNETNITNREAIIKKNFSPEFYNRLDAVVHFNALSEDNIIKVVEKQFVKLQNQLNDKRVIAIFSEDVKKFVAKNGFDAKLGARPIERFVEKEIAKPLSKEILFGNLEFGGEVTFEIVDEKVKLKVLCSYKKDEGIVKPIEKKVRKTRKKIEG